MGEKNSKDAIGVKERRSKSEIKYSPKDVDRTYMTYLIDISSLGEIIGGDGVKIAKRIMDHKKTEIEEVCVAAKFTELDDGSRDKVKVWFCGSYKVGKSTIMNCLIGADVMKSSDIYHTKGEEVYLGDAVLVDTEGFYQPLDTEEPFVRQDLIMYHMKYWCDILVMVVDRILEHELRLMNDIIRDHIGQRVVKGIVVLHNVKTITKRENLAKYAESIVENLNKTNEYVRVIKKDWFYYDLYVNLTDCVTHIFIGDIRSSLHIEQIERLRLIIGASKPGLQGFKRSIELSLRDLIKKYFDYNSLSFQQEESSISIRLIGGKRTLQSNEMALRIENKIRLRWYAKEIDSKDYLLCQLSLNEFLLQSFEIVNSRTLSIRGLYRDLSIGKAFTYVEMITPPVEIVVSDKPVILGVDSYGSYLIRLVPNDKLYKSFVSEAVIDDIFKVIEPDATWEILQREAHARRSSTENETHEVKSE